MLARWQRTVVDQRGNIVPWAVLQVRRESDQALVTIYRDRDGTDPYPTGHVSADENGYAYFYASDGLYRIRSVSPAIDWRDVSVGQSGAPGVQRYATYEDMQDALPQPEGVQAQVYSDPNESLRGFYDLIDGQWIWSDPQPANEREVARALRLGEDDPPTSGGRYLAHDNRIVDLANPQSDGDAVNQRSALLWDAGVRHYAEQLVAGVSPGAGTGAFQQDGLDAIVMPFQTKMRQVATPDDWASTQAAFNAAVLLNTRIYSPRDLTIIINDDTPLQAVVDHFSPLGRQERIRLHIESGHVLTSGLDVAYGDYSQFYITSDDPVVHLGGAGWAGQSVLRGRYAIMPSLACLIDCEELPLYGLHVDAGSCALVEEGCGMIRAGAGSGSGVEGANLFVARGSRVMAEYAQFHSSVYRNLWISQNSLAFFRGIEAHNAANQGLFLSRGSVVHADHANLSGCAVGVRNARSWASLRQSDLTNSSVQAINCFETGVVTARFAQLTGSAAGIYLFQGGGMVEISGGNCDGITGHVLETVNGVGTVSMNSVSAQGIGGKLATVTGCYDIDLSSANASGGTGATIRQGCTASMVNTQLVGSGVSGSVGLSCEDGGRAVRVSGRVSGWGQDLRVIRGSSINANGCTTTNGTPALADTNVSAFNVQSPGGGGIIYN